MSLSYYLGWRIFRLIYALYFRWRVYHPDRVPAEGPVILAANHTSYLDPPLVAAGITRQLNILARDSLFTVPVMGSILHSWEAIPVDRSAGAKGLKNILDRLLKGRAILLFPEGGRSRTGRIEEEAGAWGVGRIVGAVEGCRVLCVYMRGRQQKTWSDYPAKGDSIYVDIACIEPKSDHRGARRSRDIAQQIVGQLKRMEEAHLDGR